MIFLGWVLLPEALGEARIAAFLLGAVGGYFMGMKVNQPPQTPPRKHKRKSSG